MFILASNNVDQFLSTHAEILDGNTLLEKLGFRRPRNQIAIGFESKTPIFGSRILNMLGLKLNKGLNENLKNIKFKFLDCECLDEPVSLSNFDHLGEVECDFTMYQAYESGNAIALKSKAGAFIIISA